MQCIHNYTATEPDELTLEESDVVNVFKKMNDGEFLCRLLNIAHIGIILFGRLSGSHTFLVVTLFMVTHDYVSQVTNAVLVMPPLFLVYNNWWYFL